MSKYSALIKRATSATTALALSLASLTPAVMLGSRASAGQMNERFISMSNSKLGQSSVSYTVSFKPTVTTTIKRIVVDFCEGSPIVNLDCTNEMDTMVTPTSGTSSVLLNAGGGQSFDITGTSSGSNEVILSSATGRSITSANSDIVSFVISGITNEAADAGTFYARIVTYDSERASYADNNTGTYLDAGGVALATTNNVTINARVQEQLSFCVGSTSSYAAISDCSTGWTNSTVDLGVLDNTTTSTSASGNTTRDGNGLEGAFFVSTNAFYGVKIYYTSPNSLKTAAVSEANCEEGTTAPADQCINSDAAAYAFPSAGTEKFGMSLAAFDDNANPDGEGTISASNSYGTGYAWNTTAATEIASTTGVIAEEVGQLLFKGNAAITTPSGYYTTSANFVAVAKF